MNCNIVACHHNKNTRCENKSVINGLYECEKTYDITTKRPKTYFKYGKFCYFSCGNWGTSACKTCIHSRVDSRAK